MDRTDGKSCQISQAKSAASDWLLGNLLFEISKKPKKTFATHSRYDLRVYHCNERRPPVVARVCDNNMQAAAMSSAVATPVPFAGE